MDARLLSSAERIASRHVTQGWFESIASALARKIRLRTDIYNELATLRARLETVEAVSDDMVRHVLTKLDPTWEDDCTAKSRANQRRHMRKTIIAIMDAIRNMEPRK